MRRKVLLAVVMIAILPAGVQNAFADASVNVVSFSTDKDICISFRRENEHIFSAVCAERNK